MANEKRLIDANALAKVAEKRCGVINIKHIDEAPTVDAVEVVRCKDCKLRHEGFYNGLKIMVVHCSLNGIPVDDDDFCSYGERRMSL